MKNNNNHIQTKSKLMIIILATSILMICISIGLLITQDDKLMHIFTLAIPSITLIISLFYLRKGNLEKSKYKQLHMISHRFLFEDKPYCFKLDILNKHKFLKQINKHFKNKKNHENIAHYHNYILNEIKDVFESFIQDQNININNVPYSGNIDIMIHNIDKKQYTLKLDYIVLLNELNTITVKIINRK